ncbi:hypothetical protein [Rhodococcus sp. NBC_00294]|uniref:hypothetical protein n=1 Tax=Rhodococcus sp. NBC_00294 TaxID=2976004 RepID=UPI002E27DD42|nr:hypothetical protein [Rhodococcus sp. NBC_00294]
MLQVEEWVLSGLDSAVTAVSFLTDADSSAEAKRRMDSLAAIFEDYFDTVPVDDFSEIAEKLLHRLEGFTEDTVPRWAKRLFRDNHYRRFAKKLIGSKHYDLLLQAFHADCVILSRGIRGVASYVRPYALAFDDLTVLLTDQQVKDIGLPRELVASALRFIVEFDYALDELVESKFDWSKWKVPERDQFTNHDALADVLQQVRPLVTGPLIESLETINTRLVRRLRGANSALQHSEDGVSQAANSLVELIDWTFRTAFTDEEVISWLAAVRKDFVYDDHGRTRPTKRGQALCFVHGGATPEDGNVSALHEMMAVAIVAARTGLQGLKHADEGTLEERDQVETHLRAIEGFLTVSIRLLWGGLPTEHVEKLHLRLAA